MTKRPFTPTLFAFLLAVVASPPAVQAADSAQVLPQTATSSILFSRSTYWPDDTLRTAVLYRTPPSGAGVMQLTPTIDDIYAFGGSWSPSGNSIVYERYRRSNNRSQLFTLDRTTGALRRITTGLGKHGNAVWGPSATIAFVSQIGGQSCLSTVRSDGTFQRNLYCSTRNMDRPRWSTDGSILFRISWSGSGLEPPLHSQAYRVVPRTGAVTLLTEQTLYDGDYFKFAPDGTKGLYYELNSSTDSIRRVDFATGTLTTLANGVLPLYSKDGSHIAFTRFILGPAPDYTLSEQLFVMRADGSDQVQLTHDEVDGVEHYAYDWSKDGTRILTNQGGSMAIINVATHAMTLLPPGYPDEGSWYQP